MNTETHTTGSSETIRKTTFNFSTYLTKCPSHIPQSQVPIAFLEWFVGFSEGDGSFIVSKDRLFFIINQKEEKVLARIRTQLGFGKVSRYRSHSRFIVANREGVERLLHLFNGHLVLHKTKMRFQSWLNSWNSSCKEGEKIEHLSRNRLPCFDNNSWLSGFIDADGSFNVQRCTDSRYSLGWRVRLRFILDQKGEHELLERVCTWLGSGVISRRYQVAEMYRYTCTRVDSHEVLIEYLSKYPLHTIKNVDLLRFVGLARYIRDRKTLPWQGKVLNRVENLIARLDQTDLSTESDNHVTLVRDLGS